MRERTLDRLIRIGIVVVVVVVGFEAVSYVLDWLSKPASLVERQIDAAEKAVREQPNETGLRLRLAEIYRVANQPDGALTQYDEVLKLEETQSTALLGRGEVLAEKGDNSEAAEVVQRRSSGARGTKSSPASIPSSRLPTTASARCCSRKARRRRR